MKCEQEEKQTYPTSTTTDTRSTNKQTKLHTQTKKLHGQVKHRTIVPMHIHLVRINKVVNDDKDYALSCSANVRADTKTVIEKTYVTISVTHR